MSLRSCLYLLLLLLPSCSDRTVAKKKLPDPKTRKYFSSIGIYYGPVKSITQTISSKGQDDITMVFEWSADGRQLKTSMKGAEPVYFIAFLDPSMRVDSVVTHGTMSSDSTSVYQNVEYYKDYWHYGGRARENLVKIEVDTNRRIVKSYYDNRLGETDYFDASGLLTKTENLRANVVDTYEYDEHGSPTLIYTKFLGNKNYHKLESSYEYDSLGNWIKRVDRSVLPMINEDKIYTMTRKIVYRE